MRVIDELPGHFTAAARLGDVGDREQRVAQRELFSAPAVGEEAVMADAMEPVWQRVQQEAPDEFIGVQHHHLVLAVVPVIAPAETDPAAGERDEPAVGDRDTVRVAAEIGQHRRRSGEGPLGVSWWASTPRQALEACEFWVRKPCILYAVGNLIEPATEGRRTPRPTLGSGEGHFVSAEIPFVSDIVRQTLSVYTSAASAKALAVSPHGNYGLAGDAATIEEAQRLALERCLTAEKKMAIPESIKKPCYVYAIGDSVVLRKRSTTPMTMQR